jgi:polyferredoxin
VITFLHAFLSGFRWELFLLDPMVFILWSFVAVSMLFWGRGVFCGWLCPFGALQELLNKLARRFGVRQIAIPFGLHERLWMIKYVLFLGILAVSLSSIIAAFGLAEVEPFKTSITMKFMRDWPFVVYALVLLAAGLFVERFFCRYLCPLGGALAIPARMRMFEWLKRYRECGSECQICAVNCTVQAIHPLGQINPNECIYCLQCQANYFDGSVCLHLKKRAERRRPRAPAAASASGAPLQGG